MLVKGGQAYTIHLAVDYTGQSVTHYVLRYKQAINTQHKKVSNRCISACLKQPFAGKILNKFQSLWLSCRKGGISITSADCLDWWDTCFAPISVSQSYYYNIYCHYTCHIMRFGSTTIDKFYVLDALKPWQTLRPWRLLWLRQSMQRRLTWTESVQAFGTIQN